MPTRPTKILQNGRHDYGALEQRVFGTEQSIGNLGSKVDNVETRLGRDIGNVETNLSAAIDRISQKLDDAQSQQLNANRGRWPAILGTSATVLGVIITIFIIVGGMAISPINAELARLDINQKTEAHEREENIKQVFATLAPIAAVAAQHENDLRRVEANERLIETKWSKDAQAEYERRVDQVADLENKFYAENRQRYDKEIDNIIQDMKQSVNQQSLDRLAEHVNAGETRFDAKLSDLDKAIHVYTQSDVIKSLEERVEAITTRFFSMLAPTIPANK